MAKMQSYGLPLATAATIIQHVNAELNQYVERGQLDYRYSLLATAAVSAVVSCAAIKGRAFIIDFFKERDDNATSNQGTSKSTQSQERFVQINVK